MSRDVADALKAAIRKSGLSGNEIAKRTGVSQSAISRFLAGECDLGIQKAAKIAALLGFELTKKR